MALASSPRLLLLLPLQSILLLLLASKSSAQQIYLFVSCGNTTYTSPSPYESNLHALISNLTASIPTLPSLYSNITVGNTPSSQIYGLAQCRPDASPATCFNCLNRSAAAAAGAGVPIFGGGRGCPHRKSASVFADLCVLRYSFRSFFSKPDESKHLILMNVVNASDPERFSRSVNALMEKIIPEAAKAESRFAVWVSKSSNLADIYGMAWCTRDLYSRDCLHCLNQTLGYLPSTYVGGRVLTASCSLRFETYAYFSMPAAPPAVPPTESKASPPPELGNAPAPLTAVENGTGSRKSNNSAKTILIIVIPLVFALAVLCVILLILRRRRKLLKEFLNNQEEDIRSIENLLLDLTIIKTATSNFAEENKLGEGGFGPVYKGLLEGGQQIAVKRLSRTSSQGLIQLKNEVVLLTKLHHNNLVKLLGCCLEENEKLLIYEYLPNASLDKFIFDQDPVKRAQLDWGIRYKIIEGIGRGLLYLHEDSWLQIVHRDLKASNILLDNSMRPKISDFGLARLFHIDETEQTTNRIVGT